MDSGRRRLSTPFIWSLCETCFTWLCTCVSSLSFLCKQIFSFFFLLIFPTTMCTCYLCLTSKIYWITIYFGHLICRSSHFPNPLLLKKMFKEIIIWYFLSAEIMACLFTWSGSCTRLSATSKFVWLIIYAIERSLQIWMIVSQMQHLKSLTRKLSSVWWNQVAGFLLLTRIHICWLSGVMQPASYAERRWQRPRNFYVDISFMSTASDHG